MANSLAAVTVYGVENIDKILVHETKTAILEKGDKYVQLNFDGKKTVKIASILVDGLSDYYRANHVGVANSQSYSHDNQNNGAGYRDGYDRGDVAASWEEFTLAYDRGKQFVIDDQDNDESAGILIANTLSEFLRTRVIPEIDAVRFAKLAGYTYTTLGNRKEGAISTNSIIAEFNAAIQYAFNSGVASEDQVFFVSSDVWTKIKSTTELTKFITQGDFRSERGITFNLPAYEDRPIIVVPDDRFFDDIQLTNNGYVPAAGAHKINFLLVDKKSFIPVTKVKKYKVWAPDTQWQQDGYIVNCRIVHDSFVPNNKVVSVYAHIDNTALAAASTNRVLAGLKAGTVTNGINIAVLGTRPAGLTGTYVYQTGASSIASPFTLGASVTIDGTNVIAPTYDNQTSRYNEINVSTDNFIQFALVSDGKVVAVGDSIDVTNVKA